MARKTLKSRLREHPSMRKADRLRPGDTVAVVSPSGPVPRQRLAAGCGWLRDEGFVVRSLVPPARGKGVPSFLAASEAERARQFLRAWRDENVRCIHAARGGYGAARMAERLRASVLQSLSPKLFVGFSDLTVLLNWLADRGSLIAFHGPNVASLPETDATSRRALLKLLGGEVRPGASLTAGLRHVCGPKGAEGRLAGGNLTVLASVVGTPYFPELSGKILFLEDVNEPLYRLDRCLVQLAQAGALRGVRAVLLGGFSDIGGKRLAPSKVAALVAEKIPRNVALYTHLPVGHQSANIVLPVGARVGLSRGRLILREPVVK